MIKKVLRAGTNGSLPDYLQDKIIITNFIALVFIALCIPFLIFTYVSFPQLTFLPILFIINCGFIFFTNLNKLFHLSRFLACVVNTSLYTIYHCYLLPDNQPLIAPLYAVQIIFWMVPWLVYDWHEKTHLIVYVIFYIMISLTIPALNNLFSQVHDVTEIQNGLLGKIVFTIAAIGITGPLLFFMYNNFVSRGNSKKLVIKLEDQKKELLKKEAELNLSIRRIRESQEQEKERVWESTGLTIFSNLLRNEYESVDDVAQGVITQLVKYLDVNQGGVFLLNDTDKDNLYLELRGCFAFERSRFINKKIDVGEGMLGQCYLEKETMCINPIPKNYLKITSGLGELAPTVLLIVPIKSGQKVLGIIELAAFSELPQHKISFVEKLCESVATALLSIQANIAIRKLLASSQQLTADMKNREESMSKNMEELMLRESVYRNKIDELSSTNSA